MLNKLRTYWGWFPDHLATNNGFQGMFSLLVRCLTSCFWIAQHLKSQHLEIWGGAPTHLTAETYSNVHIGKVLPRTLLLQKNQTLARFKKCTVSTAIAVPNIFLELRIQLRKILITTTEIAHIPFFVYTATYLHVYVAANKIMFLRWLKTVSSTFQDLFENLRWLWTPCTEFF